MSTSDRASSQAVLARLTTLHSRPVDLSLERMRRLCRQLGDPQDRLGPVVHVAGTNGKGSTIAFLRAIAEAAGLRVHVYTSPHLVRFSERVRLAGSLISEEAFTDSLERVEAINDGEPITQFEATTAAAFLAFSETPADLSLIEVGLGGRFDATNVIERRALSLITPVALDHCEFLGDTLAQIAFEKAGIIAPGAPVISAAQDPMASAVIADVAGRAGAPLRMAGRDFRMQGHDSGLVFTDEDGSLDLPLPALAGAHQIINSGLAVAAARYLRLPAPAIHAGMSGAVWPARLQRITSGPLAARVQDAGGELWLDGAHNPHAIATLLPAMDALARQSRKPLCVILGLLASKDAAGMLGHLRDLQPFDLIVTDFSAAAAAKANSLAALAQAAGLAPRSAASLSDAVGLALDGPAPAPVIVVCGSLYLAGELLSTAPADAPA